jgi:hypothetical protein
LAISQNACPAILARLKKSVLLKSLPAYPWEATPARLPKEKIGWKDSKINPVRSNSLRIAAFLVFPTT